MTQEELAKKIGVQYQAINKYENGIVTNIPIERLEKIADALCVDVSTLLGAPVQFSVERERKISNAYLVNFSIGLDVFRRRAELGMTMEDLAKKLGVGKSAVSKIEKGIINLSVTQLCLLADALSVDVSNLLTIVEPTFSEAFGAVIRRRRESLCLTQEELASRMSANKQDISRYELGKTDVPLSKLPILAKALETDVSSLFQHFGGNSL